MTLDSEMLRMAFERDDPFTMHDYCFINTETDEIVWAGENVGGSPEYYRNNPLYIEVPGTSHGEWHEAFREWKDKSDPPLLRDGHEAFHPISLRL